MAGPGAFHFRAFELEVLVGSDFREFALIFLSVVVVEDNFQRLDAVSGSSLLFEEKVEAYSDGSGPLDRLAVDF